MFLCFIFLDISKKFEKILLYDNIIFRNSKTGEHIRFGNNVSFLKKNIKENNKLSTKLLLQNLGSLFFILTGVLHDFNVIY
jgi:hypothetical protein